MRDIKVRTLDQVTHKMVYYDYIDIENENRGLICGGDASSPDMETLGMYIGKYDVNKKEIYNDDIVKILVYTTVGEEKRGNRRTRYTYAIKKYVDQIGIVSWDEEKLMYYVKVIKGIPKYYTYFWQMKASDKPVMTTGLDYLKFDDWKSIEVIGNIWENPELLRTENA